MTPEPTMNTIAHYFNQIPVQEYAAHYRDADYFITLCRQCPRYENSWACPPFEPPYADRFLQPPYGTVHLIATQIQTDRSEHNDPQTIEERDIRIKSTIETVREKTDATLLKLEKIYPGSRAFFAGSCIRCQDTGCTRKEGLPCLFPDRVRPSLESIGFNIGKTTTELFQLELKWSTDTRLPEYFVLVSGLIVRLPVEKLEKQWNRLMNR